MFSFENFFSYLEYLFLPLQVAKPKLKLKCICMTKKLFQNCGFFSIEEKKFLKKKDFIINLSIRLKVFKPKLSPQ